MKRLRTVALSAETSSSESYADPIPAVCGLRGRRRDMCRNGRYTERGIKQRNVYGSEYFRVEPNFLVDISSSLGNVGVLWSLPALVVYHLIWHLAFSPQQ